MCLFFYKDDTLVLEVVPPTIEIEFRLARDKGDGHRLALGVDVHVYIAGHFLETTLRFAFGGIPGVQHVLKHACPINTDSRMC